MAPLTLHIVQAFEERDGGIVPVQPKVCPSVGSARALAARLAHRSISQQPRSQLADLSPARHPGPVHRARAKAKRIADHRSTLNLCRGHGIPDRAGR
jgi:hypothetical protein